MKALRDQQFAVAVDRQSRLALDAAVKQAIGVGVLGVALVEQGFARDKGGGEMLDEGGDSGVDQFSRHTNSVGIRKSGLRVHREA